MLRLGLPVSVGNVQSIVEISEGEDGRAVGTVRSAGEPQVRSFSWNLEFLAFVESLCRMAADSAGHEGGPTMNGVMKNLIWSFSPWVVFLLGVRIGGVYWGAGVGLAVALVVLVRALGRHSVHMFDAIGVVYFGGLLVLLATIHPSDIATWGRYARRSPTDRSP